MRSAVVLWGGWLLVGCQQATPTEVWGDATAPQSLQDEIDRDSARVLIRLQPRQYCGAAIARRVVIEGQGATIVACTKGPTVVRGLSAGILLLPGAGGSVIQNLQFEGRGATHGAAHALAFGIYAQNVNGVRVLRNQFDGTVQAVTDLGGAGWLIEDNQVRDLEVFGCPGLCGGGAAIVLARAPVDDVSADDVSVRGNRISTLAPPAGLIFSVAGVLALSVERPFIAENEIAMQGSPTIGLELLRPIYTAFPLRYAPCGNGALLENRISGADTAVDMDPACASGSAASGNGNGPLVTGPPQAMAASPLGL